MATFERFGKVGKTDNYTLTISDEYLAGEKLTTASCTVQNASVASVVSVLNDGKVISVQLNFLAEGDTELHFSYATNTRSNCETHVLVVVSC